MINRLISITMVSFLITGAVYAAPKIPAASVTVFKKDNTGPRGNVQQLLNSFLPTSNAVDLSNLTASASELNILDGVNLSTVTAANLNTLMGGSSSDASSLHIHTTGVTSDDAQLLDNIDSLSFLRSDTSDSFTSGTLTMNAGTTFNGVGTFQIGSSTVSSTAAELNKLFGTSSNVTAANLGTLTGGGATTLHSHSQTITLDDAYNNSSVGGGSEERTVTVDNGDIRFALADDANDYKLVIDNTTNATITDALVVATTGGASSVFTNGINASDAGLTNAINIGTNTILGSGSMTFDLNSSSTMTLTFDNQGSGAFVMSLNGRLEQTGLGNSVFFGDDAGLSDDLTTNENVFIGDQSGDSNTTGSANVFIGSDTGSGNTTGTDNVILGMDAGDVINASQNIFIGTSSGGSASNSGTQNTFVGVSTGLSNTTGSDNTFIGANSGDANTTGANNTAVGENAGGGLTTGSRNLFMGRLSGLVNTTGSDNTFVGFSTGDAINASDNTFVGTNTGGGSSNSGTRNVFMGLSNGLVNSTGNDNTFLGAEAGDANTTGSSNTFVGDDAGGGNTTGSNNVLMGDNAGTTNTTNSDNTIIGYLAGDVVNAANNTFVGDNAGGGSSNSGTRNVFIGNSAGLVNSTGNDNTFVGGSCGDANTSASDNTFVGSGAGGANNTGTRNVFVGLSAGLTNTTGSDNTFVGETAGDGNTTASNSTIIGDDAGDANTGASNTYVGDNAGIIATSGTNNTIIGDEAGDVMSTASDNTLVGDNAGGALTSGTRNVFIGDDAGVVVTTATDNTLVGTDAGETTTGSTNTFIGSNAGDRVTTAGSSVILSSWASRTGSMTGIGNTFVGYVAGNAVTTGGSNTCVGYAACTDTTSGTQNICIGRDACNDTATSDDNAFIGYQAGDVNTAASNVFVGSNAGGANTSGTQNVFIGKDAGLLTVTSSGNTFLGWTAGDVNTAADNTFIGDNAGGGNTSGASNVMIGHDAGSQNTTTSSLLYIDNSNTETPLIGGDFTDAGEAVGINTAISTITGSAHALLVRGSTDIGGTLQANFTGTESTAGACLDDAGTQPSNATFVSCSAAPSDIAEMYEATQGVTSGDIVATSTTFLTYRGLKSDVTKGKDRFYFPMSGTEHQISILEKTTKPYQDNVMGVISTMPVKVFGEDVGRSKSAKNPLPLALVGRVPVKVNLENAVIEVGDAITSSSTPGIGMKATKAGAIVGIALESFRGPGIGKVMMYVMNKTFHMDEKTKKVVQNFGDERKQHILNLLMGDGELAGLIQNPKSFSTLRTLMGLYEGRSSRKKISDLLNISPMLLNKLSYVSEKLVQNKPQTLTFLSKLSDEELEAFAKEIFVIEETLLVKGDIVQLTETPTDAAATSYVQTALTPRISVYGKGQLMQGRAVIELDPEFLEQVEMSAEKPMQVQVVQTSQHARGLAVIEKTSHGFTVSEIGNGISNTAFDWEVTAQRKKKEETEELLTYAP